ncbi:MAG: radical SAM protein [Firmicutes bacterium]|nr:radical SAM protein [Bacillota bacterium]
MEASYRQLLKTGELKEKSGKARERLSCCYLCAHACRVNRLQGAKGICQVDESAQISGYGPHFGEESVLVGRGGSGTIFFTGCNLRCVFCQNWEISHLRKGDQISVEELAAIMLELEAGGCHNINLVTPTPYLPQILAALEIAARQGLNLPVVYNCGGYESPTALELLDGVVDIYMPDLKFGDDRQAFALTGAKNYFSAAKAAITEMHRQVGDLRLDTDGIAYRGLIVRHLVLPGNLAATEKIVRFLAEEISPHTYLNLMDQYYPAFRAEKFPPLNRRLHTHEYEAAVETAKAAGLYRFA